MGMRKDISWQRQLHSPQELARRIKQDNAFVTRVLAQPKIWLIGDESDIAA